MEHEPDTRFSGQGEGAFPDNDIIDLRGEATDSVLEIEKLYGDNSEVLAQNTALLWTVALYNIDDLLGSSTGDENDIPDQTYRHVFYDLAGKLTASEKRAGYALLASTFTSYAGYPSAEHLTRGLEQYLLDVDLFLESNNADKLTSPDHEAQLRQLREKTEFFRCWGELYLEGVLDIRIMAHEGGSLDDFHPELYQIWSSRYLSAEANSQLQKRLKYEAEHLILTSSLELDQVNDTSV